MRALVIVAAVVALTQPAFAAKSYKHRHHVSHSSHQHHAALRRAPNGYVAQTYASANEQSFFGIPLFSPQPWQQTWAFPAAPQAGSYGEPVQRTRNARVHDGALDAMIARHAAANGLPVELVHRVVTRESGYNPGARNGSNLGLMQIKYATARGVGYTGTPAGLMDAETNLTYATRYLAGAYRAAGGKQSRAVALYASGYYGRGEPRPTRVAAATPWWQGPMMMGGE